MKTLLKCMALAGAALAASVSLHAVASNVANNPNGSGNLVFSPTNQDIDILSVSDSNVAWDYTLFMFDDAANLEDYAPNNPSFINDNSILAIDPVPVQIEFNNLTATHNQTGDTLSLTGNTNFVFGLWNHNFNGGTWIEASYATQKYAGIPDIFDIVFAFDNPNMGLEDTVVFAVDITPVPLPAAAWLFLAGFAGLAGLRARWT